MNRVKIGSINFICSIMFAILTYLVIPLEYEKLCYIPLFLTCGINILFLLCTHKKPDKLVIISGIMLVYTVALTVISPYNQNYVVRAWLSIFMVTLISLNGIDHISKTGESFLWLIALLLLLFRAIVSPRMQDGSPIFQTAFYDRIETELCIVLFMYFAVKIHKITGVIYTFAYYFLFSTSRGTLLLLIMFFGIRYFKGSIKKALEKSLTFFKKRWHLIITVFALVALYILFCYYWVYRIGSNNVVAHGLGLNDTSNFSRFASTIYAIEELVKNFNLTFYGFGGELKNIMGVAGDARVYYMGRVLVQSHNSILNMFLCFGYIPGFIYLYVLISLVKKYCTLDNLEYIFGYFVYSFIIVIIAKKGLDAFWLITIMLPSLSFSTHRVRITFGPRRVFLLEGKGNQ